MHFYREWVCRSSIWVCQLGYYTWDHCEQLVSKEHWSGRVDGAKDGLEVIQVIVNAELPDGIEIN
jgi:hypothetical protein